MSIDPEMNALESDEEDDLFEHFNFVVDKGQQLLRIDKYLQLKNLQLKGGSSDASNSSSGTGGNYGGGSSTTTASGGAVGIIWPAVAPAKYVSPTAAVVPTRMIDPPVATRP